MSGSDRGTNRTSSRRPRVRVQEARIGNPCRLQVLVRCRSASWPRVASEMKRTNVGSVPMLLSRASPGERTRLPRRLDGTGCSRGRCECRRSGSRVAARGFQESYRSRHVPASALLAHAPVPDVRRCFLDPLDADGAEQPVMAIHNERVQPESAALLLSLLVHPCFETRGSRRATARRSSAEFHGPARRRRRLARHPRATLGAYPLHHSEAYRAALTAAPNQYPPAPRGPALAESGGRPAIKRARPLMRLSRFASRGPRTSACSASTAGSTLQ